MDVSDPPLRLARPDRPALAYRPIAGRGPTVVFLPGYASDMQGSKALALADWTKRNGRACLRFDYAGCGESDGAFADQTLADWRDDALALIDTVTTGPLMLVGSSMGGWLMLLVALARPERVCALIGIAAAPDFTDWGYSDQEKASLLRDGHLHQANPYGPEATLTTAALWRSGAALCLLDSTIAIDAPVDLLHGQADADVPWSIAMRLADCLRSAQVRVTLIKDGDHRLSRAEDIALLLSTVGARLDAMEGCSA